MALSKAELQIRVPQQQRLRFRYSSELDKRPETQRSHKMFARRRATVSRFRVLNLERSRRNW